MQHNGVHMVLDSNFLQDEGLRAFLSTSRQFKVVITDYLWMEVYKTRSDHAILKALTIICDYPDQTVLLKGTTAIGALSGRSKKLTKRMIWPGVAPEFRRLCEFVRSKSDANARTTAFDEHRKIATQHMDGMLSNAADMTEIFLDIQKQFTPAEISKIRAGNDYGDSIIRKILETVMLTSIRLFGYHPHGVQTPPKSNYINTFLFRYSLCCFFLVLEWIRTGSSNRIKPEKIRNDNVDAIFASYATYFNGILTHDKKLNRVHDETRWSLQQLGAAVPPMFELSKMAG